MSPGGAPLGISAAAREATTRAAALVAADRLAGAVRLLEAAQAAHPLDSTLPLAAAQFLRKLRQVAPALSAAQRAVQLGPDRAEAHFLLGSCLVSAGRLDDAEAALRQALVLEPRHAGALNTLGIVAETQGRRADAEAHWVAAIEAGAEDTAPLVNLAALLRETGRGEEAAALLAPAAEALPLDIGLQWALALAANYAPELSAEQVAEQHRRHGRAVRARLPAESLQPLRHAPHPGPLRVGLLSPDFREHAVGWFLLPLLSNLDASRVEVTAYMSSRRTDDVTQRFRELLPRFVECGQLDDLSLVRRVRDDRLDVLVDCAGLFDGARPAALALRMAPVQATWLGYPNTTGLPNVDVRIVDAITDPPGAEALATERLVRMEAPFVCWQSAVDLPVPARNPERPVTFGCFNSLAKLHAGLLALWGRVLAAVPGSRLLLKSPALASAEVADGLRAQCVDAGIPPERLELRGPQRSRSDHLACYGDVDIALDTFPYNGTTTTCEALWMGTPVVTMAGRGHPARVGMSLLRAVGLDTWVASTEDAYVGIAAGLAADREALAQLQRALRPRLEASPLHDGPGHAQRFMAALELLSQDRLSR